MSATGRTSAERLHTPAQFLKGVGPQRAELLAKLGLRTVRDLIFQFPRDYLDLNEVQGVDELAEGMLVRLRGEVLEVEQRGGASGRSVLGVLVRCGRGSVRAMWFNQPFMLRRFQAGQQVLLSGSVRQRGGMWELAHPAVRWIEPDAVEAAAGGLLPVYPLTDGLHQARMRRMVRSTVDELADAVDEVFPGEFLVAHDLLPIQTALAQIHNPASHEELNRARRRFVYQELFVMQLALALRRQQQRVLLSAPPLEVTPKIDERIRRLFPFALTASQDRAIAEMVADMAQPHPMTRLLHGDVGSGKTAVALYAILLAVAHGYQAALMAPTEVLAQQHLATIGGFLEASRVRCGLLSGALTAGERQHALASLADGTWDVAIGTQAIVQEGISFARLGLVVIDEQHKFGVRQRATLKQAALEPHYLVMTATPIPRTMALTVFGDLDVSTLREAPPGRQGVQTSLATESERLAWWEFFTAQLRGGRQGYVVVPRIEPTDEAAAANLKETYETLANGPLEAFRLALVHGRMPHAEKKEVMEQFRAGKIQVLVSTTVIEVGVDVPNATLLTIEGAEHFGLAQLHQLRGRVSRGATQGHCCAFADPVTEESQKRLEAFVSTSDGFRLAELDFELRGPGELFGTRQHGLPPLRIADLKRDQAVLDEARSDAQKLVQEDPGLAQPQHERLRRMVLVRYGSVLELGDVG